MIVLQTPSPIFHVIFPTFAPLQVVQLFPVSKLTLMLKIRVDELFERIVLKLVRFVSDGTIVRVETHISCEAGLGYIGKNV